MYTVKELIEALQQCPEDFQVFIHTSCEIFGVEIVGIDNNEKTVDLFAEV